MYIACAWVTIASFVKLKTVDKKASTRWKYDIVELSFNFKINEFASAIGVQQMNRLDEIIKQKLYARKLYETHILKKDYVGIQYISPSVKIVPLNFPVFLKSPKLRQHRLDIMYRLEGAGIETSIYYPPIYQLSAFKKFFLNQNITCPNTELVSQSIFSLPCNQYVSKEHIFFINDVLNSYT